MPHAVGHGKSLIGMGNIYLQQHEIEKAKEKYLEAIALQVPVVASCYFLTLTLPCVV